MYALIKYVLVNGTKINRIQCNNNDNLQQILSVQRCIIIVHNYFCSPINACKLAMKPQSMYNDKNCNFSVHVNY